MRIIDKPNLIVRPHDVVARGKGLVDRIGDRDVLIVSDNIALHRGTRKAITESQVGTGLSNRTSDAIEVVLNDVVIETEIPGWFAVARYYVS